MSELTGKKGKLVSYEQTQSEAEFVWFNVRNGNETKMRIERKRRADISMGSQIIQGM